MDFSNISPRIRERAIGLGPKELLELAQREGVELSDEQLDAVAGGGDWDGSNDPQRTRYVTCCGNSLPIYPQVGGHTCPTCGRWVTP